MRGGKEKKALSGRITKGLVEEGPTNTAAAEVERTSTPEEHLERSCGRTESPERSEERGIRDDRTSGELLKNRQK